MASTSHAMSIVAWALCVWAFGPGFVIAFTNESFTGEVEIIRDIDGYNNEMRECLSDGTICVPICCQPGFSLISSECIKNNNSLSSELQLRSIYSAKHLQPYNKTIINYTRLHGIPCTPERVFTSPGSGKEWFYYLDNGRIYIPNHNDSRLWEFTRYCLASEPEDNGSVTKIAVCDYHAQRFRMNRNRSISLLASLLPIPFLIVTFVVYTVLPELNNLHGTLLKTHVAVVCFSDVIMSTLNIGFFNRMHGMSLCVLIAATLHVLQFSMFIWLNVICIDIWLTFGGYRTLNTKQRARKRYLLYSIYAWGTTSALTGICIAVESIPGIANNVIRAEFGLDLCWIHTRSVHIYFFYGPVGVSLICNICLFISTAARIVQHDKDIASQFKGADSRRHNDDKQRFYVCIKLFILMGLFWTIGLLWNRYYVHYDSMEVQFTLQGPMLFFILVLNGRTRRLLAKHLNCIKFTYIPSISRTIKYTPGKTKCNIDVNQTYRKNAALENCDNA